MLRQTVPSEIESAITTTKTTRVSLWRARAIAFLRIAFGLIWAIDAWFKWQPGFISSFTDQITKAKQDQPQGVQSWLSFWAHLVGSNPHFFAYLAAAMETALAVFLILGLLTQLTCLVGIVWSLAIWAIPEGFGGPYKPGDSTDVGTALLYALMFAVLFAIAAGRYYSIDQWLTPRLSRFGFLAAGVPRRGRQ
ncbi:MAG: DoxX family membrane protein [Chloroflexi bacterium]|nr:MAG: DoxX family membrane protein [Chloroflexota bacterium]